MQLLYVFLKKPVLIFFKKNIYTVIDLLHPAEVQYIEFMIILSHLSFINTVLRLILKCGFIAIRPPPDRSRNSHLRMC